jgi:hypothetical protein
LQAEKLKPIPVNGDAAAGPVPRRPNCDKEFVSQIEELLRLQPEVLECVEPVSPELEVPLMAVEDRLKVGRRQVVAGPIFDLGIKAHEENIEVSAIGCRVSPHYKASEHQPPKARSPRQSPPGLTEETEKAAKVNKQAVVQSPALDRSFTERRERDSYSPHDLDVLLRHRPRSISRRRRRAEVD